MSCPPNLSILQALVFAHESLKGDKEASGPVVALVQPESSQQQAASFNWRLFL